MNRSGRPRALANERSRPARAPLLEGNQSGADARLQVVAVWTGLALLVAARAVTAALPGMWVWSLGIQRFLDPALGWGTWALAAASLIPAVGRWGATQFEATGRRWARHAGLSSAACAAAAAGLVLSLPDRAQFVGDFLLRQATLHEGVAAQAWYPQAMPLDLVLHDRFAGALMLAFGLEANMAGRLIGAAEAAILALLAVRLARVLDLRGTAGAAVSVVLFWGGYLTMFTGYNKAFSEMCLLTAGVGVFGLDAVRRGRGLAWVGGALALAVLVHRSAIGLLPAGAVAGWSWLRDRHEGRAGRAEAIAAFALPLAVLAVEAPRIVHIVTQIDPIHFAPGELHARGLLAATFAGTRGVDLLNLLLMLSPLGWVSPLLVSRAARAPREATFLAALVLPLVAIVPFVHPGQGYFRDWDDFVAAGVALSVAAAWSLGALLRAERQASWLALAICLGAAVPSLQWVAHQASLDHGLARARAFVEESPARGPMERYTTWEYLGMRLVRVDRLDQAAIAFQRAADAIPTPHILQLWAMTEMNRGDFAAARSLYRRILGGEPRNAFATWQCAVASFGLGDWPEAERDARQVLELDPTNQGARDLLAQLARRAAGPRSR